MENRIVIGSFAIVLFIAGMVLASLGFAATGKVTIFSPSEGATVEVNHPFKLEYEAVPGPNGDHLHLNVDGKREDVIHQLKGATDVEGLSPGKHQVCLAINTKSHVPTGVEQCIDVMAK